MHCHSRVQLNTTCITLTSSRPTTADGSIQTVIMCLALDSGTTVDTYATCTEWSQTPELSACEGSD